MGRVLHLRDEGGNKIAQSPSVVVLFASRFLTRFSASANKFLRGRRSCCPTHDARRTTGCATTFTGRILARTGGDAVSNGDLRGTCLHPSCSGFSPRKRFCQRILHWPPRLCLDLQMCKNEEIRPHCNRSHRSDGDVAVTEVTVVHVSNLEWLKPRADGLLLRNGIRNNASPVCARRRLPSCGIENCHPFRGGCHQGPTNASPLLKASDGAPFELCLAALQELHNLPFVASSRL